jgi:uncharacterized protein YjiS (DUF1127 family)
MIPDSRMWRTTCARARQVAAWPFRVAAARATLKALANMDRRELADIGLNSSDVRDAGTISGRRHLDQEAAGSTIRTTCPGAIRRHRGRDRSRPGRKSALSEQAKLRACVARRDGRLAEQVSAQLPRRLAEAESARGHLEPTPDHPGVGP